MHTWKYRPHIPISFELQRYTSGGTAVEALEHEHEDDDHTSHYARISVNIEEAPRLPEGQFYLKHWMENDAITAAMMEQGLIEQVQPPVLISLEFGISFACQFTEKGRQYCQ